MHQRSNNTAKQLTRRGFAGAAAAVLAAGPVSNAVAANSAKTVSARRPQDKDVSLQGRVFKSLKIGMVEAEGSLADKFKAAKAAGFEAIEMNSPGMDVAQTLAAIQESGLPVDGTVCSTHWDITHTSPDPEMRKNALDNLVTAIRDTRAVGGSTVLLVVGVGRDGPEDEIWKRSLENIHLALPEAARHGISIVIENVWNRFLYDHEGDSSQTAEKFVRYIDEFNSPLVGMQFDIGNHRKYGNMADWIRQLGKRIIKLDVKGYSREQSDWSKIGEGDVDWADVRRALVEINFYGYAAAEVSGGGQEWLNGVSDRLGNVLGLDPR